MLEPKSTKLLAKVAFFVAESRNNLDWGDNTDRGPWQIQWQQGRNRRGRAQIADDIRRFRGDGVSAIQTTCVIAVLVSASPSQ
jgi:hypothetical protein